MSDPNSIKGRIIILGGGAVGSSIAASLSNNPDHEIVLVARKDHLYRIDARGLELKGKINNNFKNITTTEKIDFKLSDDDYILFTVKAGQLEESILDVIPFLSKNSKLVFLQNGYGIKELAIRVIENSDLTNFSIKNIFAGIVAMGATFNDPGIINFWGGEIKFQTGLEELDKIFSITNEEYEGFIKSSIRKDILKDTWMKLIINSIVNPLSVILKGKNNFIAEDRFDSLKEPLLNEGVKIALAEDGVDLSHLTVSHINKYINTNNITSMYQDFLKMKKNEIDFINGKIIELGKKNKIDVTNNIMIYNIIKSLEDINLGK